MAVFFMIAKIRKQLKCPSTDEFTNKMRDTHTHTCTHTHTHTHAIAHYSAIKKRMKFCLLQTWMNLEGIC